MSENETENPEFRQRDIVEVATEQVKLEHDWFDAIFHGARDAIFIANEDGQFVNFNRAAETLTGYSSEELSSMGIEDLHESQDLDAYNKFFNRILNGEEITSEAMVLRKDGSKIPVEFSNKGLEIDGRRFMHAIARDISDRKKAQQELFESEKRYRELFEKTPIGIFKTDSAGKPLVVNPAMARMLGAESVEETLVHFNDLSHSLYIDPERRDEFIRILREKGHVENFEYEARKLDGEKLILNMNAQIGEHLPDGSFTINGFTSDVTEQRSIDAALKESYRKYNSFLNNTTEGIYLRQLSQPVDIALPIDEQIDAIYEYAEIIECNHALACMYGVSRKEELLGKNLVDIHGGTNHPVNRREMRKFIENGYRETSEISHEKCLDGEERWFLNSTTGVVENGMLVYLWGTQIDVSENRRAEEKIIRLSEAISQLEEAVIMTDRDATINYANPASEELTGYSSAELIGEKPSLLNSGKEDEDFYSTLWNTLLSGDRWTGNIVNKRKNGTLFTSHSSISPIKDSEGMVSGFLWISRDITEELSLRKSMEQTRKMEALGTLAGGIAHDFNNILTSVLGFTELALNEVEAGSLLEERLQAVYAAGNRARELVKQILTFARRSEKETNPVQINILVKESLNLLRPTIPTTVDIKSNIASKSKVMGVPTQIHQIVMNLCTNAAQAMEETGGSLEISLKDVKLTASDTRSLVGLKPGEYLELKISDTGKGIPRKHLESIFEPYFTTKKPGEGTGMGLATVHSIVKEYKGEILVDSQPGKGSVFTIYLPIHKKGEQELPTSKKQKLQGGSERIMVVDDEPQVVKITGLSLKRLGYDITTFQSSREALQAFTDNPDAFDLVITDMTMPEMTGDQLTSRLLQIRPELPVILCTGYSKKFAGKEAEIEGIKAFAYKPVTTADLAAIVRKVLDEESENDE